MFKYGLYRFLALVVRVAYLVSLYSGVYLMFSRAGVTESSMGEVFTVTIAAAVLLHEFLQQTVLINLFRTFMRNQENEDLKRQVLFHGGVMLALTCFDAYCVWQLSPAALVLPALFFTSSLLVEADEDAGGMLARQAHAMLMQTTRITVKQWKARMNRARKLSINLAPVNATLMEDAGNKADARRITIIDHALTEAERTHPMDAQHGWLYNLFHRGESPAPKPPTGPGSPMRAPSVRTAIGSQSADDETFAEAEMDAPMQPVLRPVRTGRRTAASRAAEEKRLRRSRERFIAAQLAEDPTIATRELLRRLRRAEHSRVSESTVSEIRHVVEARMGQMAK